MENLDKLRRNRMKLQYVSHPIALMMVLIWPLKTRALPQNEGAQVSGHVFIAQEDSKHVRPVQGWDLSKTVIYLVPQGHTLPVEPPTPPLVVTQKNAQFRPSLLVIPRGQTVDFLNDDNIDHNVFSFSKAERFDLGLYPRGQKKSVTFDQEGPVITLCSIHEFMSAVIYVVPNRLNTVADAKGAFLILDVPPGKYMVRSWHTELPEGQNYVDIKPIDAQKGQTVHIEINLGDLTHPSPGSPRPSRNK